MFNGCSKLSYIKALYTTLPESYTKDWLKDVSPTGTFIKNPDAEWERRGPSGIPEGWEIINPLYTFTDSLSFNGSQYILTDIDLRKPEYVVEIKFTDNNTVKEEWRTICSVKSYDNVRFIGVHAPRNTSNIVSYAAAWFDASIDLKSAYRATDTIVFKNGSVTLTGEPVTNTGTSLTSKYPMKLMIGADYTANSSGFISSFSETNKPFLGSIHYVEIKDSNNNLVCKLEPCVKKNGEIGLYDNIKGKLYKQETVE
jgi:hypothetical protein